MTKEQMDFLLSIPGMFVWSDILSDWVMISPYSPPIEDDEDDEDDS